MNPNHALWLAELHSVYNAFLGEMKNLLWVLERATSEDIEKAMRSWPTYHWLTSRMARDTGFSDSVGAAVFAALSPNNDYYGNLRDCRRLLEGACMGLPVEAISVSTYTNNKRKAYAITQGANPLDLIVFPKTRNFYLNIKDPNDPEPVTVDGHIFNAWEGSRMPLKGAAQRFRAKHYETVANALREIARQQKLLANQVQGIIWFAWRRIHGILYSAQQELWSREARAAGYELPYHEVEATFTSPLCL